MANQNWTDQRIDTVTPLVGSASFGGTVRDLKLVGRYGVSVFVQRDTVDSDADVIVENSDDNVTYRHLKTTNLPVTAADPDNEYNEVFVPTRRFMRFRIVNNTANDLAATEGISTTGVT